MSDKNPWGRGRGRGGGQGRGDGGGGRGGERRGGGRGGRGGGGGPMSPTSPTGDRGGEGFRGNRRGREWDDHGERSGGRGRGDGDRRGGGERGERGSGSGGGRGGSYRGGSGDRAGRGSRGDFRGSDRGGDRGGGRGGGRGRGGKPPVEKVVFEPRSAVTPDPRIRQAENENEAEIGLQRLSLAAPLDEVVRKARFPLRPGYGSRGTPVRLWSNYFAVNTPVEDLPIYRYSVKITQVNARPAAGTGRENEVSAKKRTRLIQILLEDHLSEFRSGIATDFKSLLISTNNFPDEKFTIKYKEVGEDEPSERASEFTVAVERNGTFTLSNLLDLLDTRTDGETRFGRKEEIIGALNIIFGHYPRASSDIISFGGKRNSDGNRHFKHTGESSEWYDLGGSLIGLRGFFLSVRAATSRLLVNVQVKYGAFFKGGNLSEIIMAWQRTTSMKDIEKRIRDIGIVKVLHIVKRNSRNEEIVRLRSIVGFAHVTGGRGSNPPRVLRDNAGPKDVQFWRKYPETGTATSPTPAAGPSRGRRKRGGQRQGPARAEEGEYVSVWDHFREKYPDFRIKNDTLPVIEIAGGSYLPAEACFVLPDRAVKMELSGDQMGKMAQFAIRKPMDNATSIKMTGISMLGLSGPNETLNAFNFQVSQDFVMVDGRVLNTPSVKYAANKMVHHTEKGSWNLRDVKFSQGKTLNNWVYLRVSTFDERVFAPFQDDKDLSETIKTFVKVLGNCGITASSPRGSEPVYTNKESVEQDIGAAVDRIMAGIQPNMILVILPPGPEKMNRNPDTDRILVSKKAYNRLKYLLDVQHGVRNVCVLADKFRSGGPGYAANVAMKINLKLGGQNHLVDSAKLGIISEGKTMVVGIDVTHPQPGSTENAPSVASVVASIDKYLAQWPADLRVQTRRQEMVSDLKDMMESRLRLWQKNNSKKFPENIIVYRDGVSEGQFLIVLDEELVELRKACEALYPAPDTKKGLPRITIIIVTKRHNTRFYPTSTDDADDSSNPKNGTVVDRGITLGTNWDFFLQAHTALKGTAKPAHYYVLYDEIFRYRPLPSGFTNTADVVEDLTHNMCYLFGRATKAVSICPPAYYADIACTRARCYLPKYFEPGSSDKSAAGSTSAEDVERENIRVHENVKDTMFYI